LLQLLSEAHDRQHPIGSRREPAGGRDLSDQYSRRDRKAAGWGSAYVLHFDRGATPPANTFWSVTLYDAQGYQVVNSLNRFAVSSWMPFKYNPDGSLDLYPVGGKALCLPTNRRR
jgi:Protein of unknown function (DUF1214)